MAHKFNSHSGLGFFRLTRNLNEKGSKQPDRLLTRVINDASSSSWPDRPANPGGHKKRERVTWPLTSKKEKEETEGDIGKKKVGHDSAQSPTVN